MKKIGYGILLLWLLIGLIGCNNNDNNTDENKDTKETAETNENKEDTATNEKEEEETKENEVTLPALVEQKTVEMMLEGMPEDKIVNVYHHKELGFSTYVPDDMVVEANPEVFNVFTNFGGTKNEDATIKIANQTEQELLKTIGDSGFTLEEQETKAFEFSDKEFSLQKEGMIGRAAVFQHNDKDYVLYYYFPEEYADGFGPRSDIIIKEIVWHDEQQ